MRLEAAALAVRTADLAARQQPAPGVGHPGDCEHEEGRGGDRSGDGGGPESEHSSNYGHGGAAWSGSGIPTGGHRSTPRWDATLCEAASSMTGRSIADDQVRPERKQDHSDDAHRRDRMLG